MEKIRARRDAKEEAEQPLSSSDLFKKSKLNPNYKLAQKLRDYLEDHWTGVESDQIVSKFDGHVKNSAVFKVSSLKLIFQSEFLDYVPFTRS